MNKAFVSITLLFTVVLISSTLAWNPIQNEPTGVAASGGWTDPQGVPHNYYVYTQHGGVTARNCAMFPPQSVRNMVPANHILFLVTIASAQELEAIKGIVKSQKAPYRFARETAYAVDNFYDVYTKQWVTSTGTCSNGYIPWGDACRKSTQEPNFMSGKILEYCSSLDFRGSLVCNPGDKCSNNGKAPYNPNRHCNYDGVYNNNQCGIRLTGCIYESQPAPLPPSMFSCRPNGIALCPDGQVNLIRNGDFELGQYNSPATTIFQTGSFGLFSWIIERGTVRAEYKYAAHGQFSIGMNAAGTGALLSQSLSVDASIRRVYQISFQVAPMPGQKGNAPVKVSILDTNGGVMATKTIDVNGGGWRADSLSFTSNAGQGFYSLQFQSVTGNPGPAIDAVTACAGAAVNPPPPPPPPPPPSPAPSSAPSNTNTATASRSQAPPPPNVVPPPPAPSSTNTHTSVPSLSSAASRSHSPQQLPPPILSQAPPPPAQCGIGNNLLTNPNFIQGNLQNSYSGANMNLVGAGKGTYDILDASANNQNAITGWNVAAGPILWSSGAFPNAAGTTRTLGMTPGSSITTKFTVPTAGIGYKLVLYVAANPFSPASLKTAATVQQLTITVRGATYNRFAAPSGVIPIKGDQAWYQVQYVFSTLPDQKNYILDIQLSGTQVQIGSVPYATIQNGILVGALSLCQSVESVSLQVGDRCGVGAVNDYLKNPTFQPVSGASIHGNTGVSKGDPRINPWAITANAIDHYFVYWQNPPGADYTIDLSGTVPLTLGAIQQTVTLPSSARTFTLNFDLAGNVDCAPAVKHLRVRILLASNQQVIPGGQNDWQFNTAGKSKKNMGWVNKQWSFRTIEGQTNYIVEFSSLDNTNCGPVIALPFLCDSGDNPADLHPKVCNNGQTANAVSNGDFEYISRPITDALVQVYAGSAFITAWSVFDGTVELYRPTGWIPAHGQNSIDMDGISAGTLVQTLRLPFGYPWTLTFAMAANPGVPPATKEMVVTIYKADASYAIVKQQTFSWTTDPSKQNKDNMGWAYQSLDFNTFTETPDYVVEFKSITPGYAGVAIDDVKVCSPRVLTYPPTGPYIAPSVAPPIVTPIDPQPPGTIPTTWTVTADNEFEFYVDGVEIKPTNADSIDVSRGCAAPQVRSSPNSKYCCNNAASGAHPRCDWTKSETFTVPITPDRSVIAIHVVNFPSSAQIDDKATDPTDGGPNPAALLASYVRDGRQCGVSDLTDWRCTLTLSQAEINNGAWTQTNYDDSDDKGWKNPVSFGLNGPGSFYEFGGQAAQLYKGNSIWYSGAGQIPGIPTYAQWIWGAAHEAGKVPQMWCRTFVPNLYC